ncbi:MAG: tetratricopeptide repeat protein [Candidatus Kryptoniota bacterium]
MRNTNPLILTFIALMPILLGGCFIWNTVKSTYTNFSAYFNTYYNAKTNYDAAIKEFNNNLKEYRINILSGARPYPFQPGSMAKQKFDVAIEKASKILQFYPDCSFIEDCLYMIGISYYDQGENIRSEKKFMEAMTKFPTSERFAEAKMYYGKIKLREHQYTDARDNLKEALELGRSKRQNEVAAQACDGLADYYLSQNDSARAAAYLDTASTYSTRDDAALYACEAGVIFERIGNYNSAIKAYKKANSNAVDIRLKFYSAFYESNIDRIVKRYSLALDMLNRILSDDKYFTYFPLADFMEAKVLADSGSLPTAVQMYQRIDTAYASNEAATRSAFELAKIYYGIVGDFTTSLKFFQRCSSHPAVYPISDSASLMVQIIQDYFVNRYKAYLADSLYQKAETAVQEKDTSKSYNQAELDTLYAHAASANQALAGFFMVRMNLPDSAVVYYKKVVNTFPRSREYPSALYSLGEYYWTKKDTAEGRGYLERLIREHPETNFASAASALLNVPAPVVVDSSETDYDSILVLINRDKIKPALSALYQFLARYDKSHLYPRALYTLGWLYENRLNLPDSAYTYYKKLSKEFPTNSLSSTISKAVSGYEMAQLARKDSTSDSTAKKGLLPQVTTHGSSPIEENEVQGVLETKKHVPDTLKNVIKNQRELMRVRR